MNATRILVVEDEAVVAKDLQQRLRKLGYEVPVTVSTGEAAVREATELQPHLVLMDVRLKGEMDGIEAASRIHESSDIPIIFLTAYADANTVDRAKVIEPFGYILKPFAERELHTAIQVGIYKHQIEANLRRSERWLGATLRSISDAVIALDSRAEIVFMNSVAENLTGCPQIEAEGRKARDVFRTTGRGLDAMISDAHGTPGGGAEHALVDETAILISRDGRQLNIEGRAAPIRDEKGNITGTVLVFRDIEARKRNEDALRASEEHFRLLVEGVKDYGIFMLDWEGKVISWNPGAERVVGYRAEEIVGKSFSCFYTPEDLAADKARASLAAAAQKGSYQQTGWRLRKDGSRFHADILVTALRNESGELTGFSKLIRDITERIESEERFRQTQKLESLGVLAGGVAHDFNNLLTGILGNCSLALDRLPESDPIRDQLQEAIKAAERAAALTQQLLSYAGKGHFYSRPIDLSNLTNEISSLIRASIPKNVRLNLELDPEIPAVMADPGQIQQIVMNLVINGAEASGIAPDA